jgi:hypothetical protein
MTTSPWARQNETHREVMHSLSEHLHFGVRLLAAAFSAKFGSRQLAGALEIGHFCGSEQFVDRPTFAFRRWLKLRFVSQDLRVATKRELDPLHTALESPERKRRVSARPSLAL